MVSNKATCHCHLGNLGFLWSGYRYLNLTLSVRRSVGWMNWKFLKTSNISFVSETCPDHNFVAAIFTFKLWADLNLKLVCLSLIVVYAQAICVSSGSICLTKNGKGNIIVISQYFQKVLMKYEYLKCKHIIVADFERFYFPLINHFKSILCLFCCQAQPPVLASAGLSWFLISILPPPSTQAKYQNGQIQPYLAKQS